MQDIGYCKLHIHSNSLCFGIKSLTVSMGR